MAPKKTHGMSYTKEYKCWSALKNRCLNPKNIQYKDYGGRGITICERWFKFENFYEDMGMCPEKSEIDRVDNEKGYCKENCRWTTKKINSRNRRSTKKHKTCSGILVQQELIEKIGWTKNQFRWFFKKYGIQWILENFKNGTLSEKINKEIIRDDIVGQNFGYWSVLKFDHYIRKKGHMYLCKCKCGEKKLIPRNNLMKNKTSKCKNCAADNLRGKPKGKIPL